MPVIKGQKTTVEASEEVAVVNQHALEASVEKVEKIEKDDEDKERAPRAHAPRETKAEGQLRENDALSLKEYMEALSANGAMRIRLSRTHPKMFNGVKVDGHLATYNEQIDEDFIAQEHGGGDFYIDIRVPKAAGGGFRFGGGRTIKIAGNPRTDNLAESPAANAQLAAPAPTSNAVVDRAFSAMEKQLDRQTAEQGRTNGVDHQTLRMFTDPMRQQIEAAERRLEEKDRQLAMAQQRAPEVRDDYKDKLLSQLLDAENARIGALRAQYDSELRMARELAVENERRLRDGFERDRQALTAVHDREVATIRESSRMMDLVRGSTSDTTTKLMEAELRRIREELVDAKAELVQLRLKKDKSILEQAKEFQAIKEAFGDMGDEKEESSTFEKIAGVVAQLPMVQGALSKMGGAPEAPRPVQAPPPMRPQLMTGPDGGLYRRHPNGQMELVRQRARPAVAPGEAPPVEIAPETAKAAIAYLENAFRGDQDPAAVATSVRAVIPANVLEVIKERGVDGFLEAVHLDPTSPLTQQAGKNWIRKVGKALVGG